MGHVTDEHAAHLAERRPGRMRARRDEVRDVLLHVVEAVVDVFLEAFEALCQTLLRIARGLDGAVRSVQGERREVETCRHG